MGETQQHQRPIRSYVLRCGRMTGGQERAFADLWPKYGLDPAEGPIDPALVFGPGRPVHLEIGFGNGEALLEAARQHPGNGYIGIEVHRPGVGHLLLKLDEEGLENVRVIRHDALEVLRRLPDHCLDAVMLFFPDPWHKRKHHKRRIVQPEFAALCARLLRPGGLLHMATDWEHYARQMLRVLTAAGDFENRAGEGGFSPRPEGRPLTRFEQRGQRLGHGVWDLLFQRR